MFFVREGSLSAAIAVQATRITDGLRLGGLSTLTPYDSKTPEEIMAPPLAQVLFGRVTERLRPKGGGGETFVDIDGRKITLREIEVRLKKLTTSKTTVAIRH